MDRIFIIKVMSTMITSIRQPKKSRVEHNKKAVTIHLKNLTRFFFIYLAPNQAIIIIIHVKAVMVNIMRKKDGFA